MGAEWLLSSSDIPMVTAVPFPPWAAECERVQTQREREPSVCVEVCVCFCQQLRGSRVMAFVLRCWERDEVADNDDDDGA